MMILNNLKNQIIELLNNSNISIEAIYYVMKDVMDEVNKTYQNALMNEMQSMENNNTEEEKMEDKEEKGE